MNYKFNSIEYKPCIKCKITLAKPNEDYCNGCKYKPSSKKSVAAVKYKLFITKFKCNNNKNIKCSDSQLGIVNINNSKIQRNISFINSFNSQNTADFTFCLEFNNINDLSSFILKSKQVNLAYLLLVGANRLQSAPKIRKLIENQEELSSYKIYHPKPSTLPYTSPLQLLSKPRFWDNLLNVYIQNFYEKAPIFTIAHFDPETAPQSLMAAIYYSGYKSQPDQPEELTLYMDNYAKENIKLLIRQCSLTAIQALLVYFAVYYHEGNTTLHFTCRAHATRIGYAIGIHLDNKVFSEIEKYNRRLVLIKLRGANIMGSSPHNLSTSFLTEFGSCNLKPIKPEWQTLKKSMKYYESENERLLHGVCYAHYIDYYDELKCNVYSSLYNIARDSRYKYEWNKTRKDVTRIYQKYIRIFQSLSSTHPNYVKVTSKYELQVCLYYHDTMIDMYSKLINKIEDLSLSDIEKAIYHLDWMLRFILPNNQPRFPTQTLIILLGYQYICFYKLCSPSNRRDIQSKLAQIIQALSIYYTPSNALSFIILKNGYKSIINDNN